MRRVLAAHPQGVTDLVFQPDGRTALSGGRWLKLWDLASGEALRQWPAHAPGSSYPVSLWIKLARHPDCARIFSSDGAETALWLLASGEELWRAQGRLALLFHEGRRAVLVRSGGLDVHDLETREVVCRLAVNKKTSPLYHPAMEGLTGEEIEAHTPDASVEVVDLLADGRLAVGTSESGTELFDLATGRAQSLPTERLLRVLPGGRTLLTASSSSHFVWEVETGARTRQLGAGEAFRYTHRHVALPGGERALVALGGDIALVGLETGEELLRRTVDARLVTTLLIHPGGRYALVEGTARQSVLRWDLERDTISPLRAPARGARTALHGFTPDGGVLGSSGQTLLVWDVASRAIASQWDAGLRIDHATAGPSGALAAWSVDQWGRDASFALFLNST